MARRFSKPLRLFFLRIMKYLFAVAVALALVAVMAGAKDFTLAESRNTISGTVFTASGSNAAGQALSTAFDIEKATYHSLQWVTTCTNESVLTLWRSLDGIAWTGVVTNTVTATETNSLTMEGKWKYLAAQFSGTNATVVVKYLGQ